MEKAEARQITLDAALERLKTKMQANGNIPAHIRGVIRRIRIVLNECGIDSLADIRREAIERWIANERQKGVRSAQTINIYLISLKSFMQYLTDVEILPNHPLKSIRRLNAELDRRRIRRALTQDEINRLLNATASGRLLSAGPPDERVLIYRMLVGTGLRSTELSLLTPSQIDFVHCLEDNIEVQDEEK